MSQDQTLLPPFVAENKALILVSLALALMLILFFRPKAAEEAGAPGKVKKGSAAMGSIAMSDQAPTRPGGADYSSTPGVTPIFTFSAGPLARTQADNPRAAAAISAAASAMSAARTRSDSAAARSIASPDVLAGLGQRTGINSAPDYNISYDAAGRPRTSTGASLGAKAAGTTDITIYLSAEATEEVAVRDSVRIMQKDGRFGPGQAVVRITSASEARAPLRENATSWPIIIAKNGLGVRTLFGVNSLHTLSLSVSDGPD